MSSSLRALLAPLPVLLLCQGCLAWIWWQEKRDERFDTFRRFDTFERFDTSRRFDSDSERDSDADADSDVDTDTDADGDSDTDVDHFQAEHLFVDFAVAFDGASLTSWQLSDATTPEPSALELQFGTEEYVTTGDEAEMCIWVGAVQPLQDISERVEGAWMAQQVSLSLVHTTCANFDPELWGDDDPTVVIESHAWVVVTQPITQDMSGHLRDAVVGSGLDWEADWEPYVAGGWAGLEPGDGLTPTPLSEQYLFTFQLQEGGVMSYDEAGDPVLRAVAEVEASPANSLFNAKALTGGSAAQLYDR